MANELAWRHTTTGVTVYVTIRSAVRTYWYTVTPALEALTVAHWADYDVALAESPASSYFYVGTWPAALSVAGWYWVDVYQQAGAAPAISDTLIGGLVGYWNGTTFAPWGSDAVQTGDAYARLGAPVGASVSADIAVVKAETAAILDDTSVTLMAEFAALTTDAELVALITDELATEDEVAAAILTTLATDDEIAAAVTAGLATDEEIASAVLDETGTGHTGLIAVALPDAAPGSSGGLPTVDNENYIAGIQGDKNTLDDLSDISITQQDMRDAMLLPPTGGDEGIDTKLDNIIIKTDLITAGTPTITSLQSGGHLTIIAGATFDPPPIAGLTIASDWVTAYCTVKITKKTSGNLAIDDSTALVQIKASNPGAAGDGLLYLNAAGAADDDYGSLALNILAGTATIIIEAAATVLLAERAGLCWDIKTLNSDDSVDVVCSGTAEVILTSTKTI